MGGRCLDDCMSSRSPIENEGQKKRWEDKSILLNVRIFCCHLAKPNVDFPQNTMNVLAGKPANLSCVVFGSPKPNVLWIKNIREIHQSDHYYISENPTSMQYTWQSVLHIASTWQNDTGNYSCFVRNVAGTNISNMTLNVFGMDSVFVIFHH